MGFFDDIFEVVNDLKAVGTEFTNEVMGLKDEVSQPISDVTEHLSGAVDSLGETAGQVTDAKNAVASTVNKLSGK